MRKLMWAGVVLLVVAVAVAAGWWNMPQELHGVALQSPRVADDFTLTASTGEPKSLTDFRGKYVVIYFGYTSCPDVCPTTMNDLKQMAGELGAERMEDVQVILV